MTDEANVNQDDKAPIDGEDSTPEEGVDDEHQDELDSLLDIIDKKSEPDDDAGKNPDDDAGKDKDKGYFKKVGTHVFKTEADYDAFATKNYGEVTRLSGELQKATDLLKANPESKQAEVDVQKLRMQMKAEEFFEDNPDALNYREEMAAFLRSGKAKDAKGRLSIEVAYEKALRADGKEPVESEARPGKESTKKILTAGGSEGGRMSENSEYNEDSIQGLSDFADSAIAKKI